MSELPEPLTPADCDLRDFNFMPLDVLRLRDSDTAALPDAEAFRASVIAWCVSWHQVPAASLPDDDVVLCRLLGYGRDVKGWQRIRAAGGLRGFVKCSDGRIYHPVVSEKARESWERKLSQRERSRKGNAARWGGREPSQKDPGAIPEGSTGDPTRTEDASHKDDDPIREGVPNRPKGQGQGEGEGEVPPPTPRKRGAEPLDGFEEFWRHYPRKIGKGEAERAWPRAVAAAGGDVDLIIGGVKVALGTDRLDMREGGRFCPHPATWLNGKRWLDGLDPEPDPQPTLLPRH